MTNSDFWKHNETETQLHCIHLSAMYFSILYGVRWRDGEVRAKEFWGLEFAILVLCCAKYHNQFAQCFFLFPQTFVFASFVCFLSGGEVEFRPLFLKLRLTKITFFDMKNTWYLVGMYIWAFWGYCSTVFFVCVCVRFLF